LSYVEKRIRDSQASLTFKEEEIAKATELLNERTIGPQSKEERIGRN